LKIALDEAKSITEEDETFCKNIGLNGLKIIEDIKMSLSFLVLKELKYFIIVC